MAADYGTEVKAAVLAALLTGQSISSVAKEYSIPVGTIKSWKSRKRDLSPAEVAEVAEVATRKKAQIGDLLLDYLYTALNSLRIQAEHFGDKSWLAKQNAADLAVLHGVSTDKIIRLLEALSSQEQPEQPTSGATESS